MLSLEYESCTVCFLTCNCPTQFPLGSSHSDFRSKTQHLFLSLVRHDTPNLGWLSFLSVPTKPCVPLFTILSTAYNCISQPQRRVWKDASTLSWPYYCCRQCVLRTYLLKGRVNEWVDRAGALKGKLVVIKHWNLLVESLRYGEWPNNSAVSSFEVSSRYLQIKK